MADVELTDNTAEVLSALEQGTGRALEITAFGRFFMEVIE